jgi:adenosine/AMP kinase
VSQQDPRPRVYKALGEVENEVLTLDDLHGAVHRSNEQQQQALAFHELGELVKYGGLDDAVDINRTDCRIYRWRQIAAVAVCAIARIRHAQEQEGT